MKKGMLVLFVGIFMIGIVSAAICDDNQTIMKLYQQNNSHGALWNDTNYNWDICYGGAVPATPHPTCDDDNSFLWLYSADNSHASTTKTDYYATGVCYGDLECSVEVISDGSNCSDGSEPILSLYSQTNSHMAAGNYDGYDVKICCGASEIYWADANGVEITQADEVNIGDTIQAVVTNTGAGTFTIKDAAWVDETARDIVGDGSSGDLIGKWMITQADLYNAGGKDNIYFIVDGDGDNPSDEISINGTYDDSPMDVTIVSPACGNHSDKGSNLVIEVTATDEDDFINGTVSINGVVKDTFVNGGVSFSYDFSLPGNYQIVAEAVNTREKRARHISNIMIVDRDNDGSKYVAACILKPKDFSDMEESTVEFDASTTRGVEIVGGVASVVTPVASPTSFSWYWRFLPDDVVREFVKSSELKAYRFNVTFPIAGDNSANLRVEFE